MNIAVIGVGAIAAYVRAALSARGDTLSAIIVRPERLHAAADLHISHADDLPSDTELVIDCAGHSGLTQHGPAILERGLDLVTLSLGALADQALFDDLTQAAANGHACLHLASGAIGGLDCLQAARVGQLSAVTYTGRKPPQGWRGSPAETVLDLDALTTGAATHFTGSAREAALRYPKNANVAAAVALAGIGFDATQVALIADADGRGNVHDIAAQGDFGEVHVRISGHALPDNPRSSALAAMSAVAKVAQLSSPIRF